VAVTLEDPFTSWSYMGCGVSADTGSGVLGASGSPAPKCPRGHQVWPHVLLPTGAFDQHLPVARDPSVK
jgi:hypothetical protein